MVPWMCHGLALSLLPHGESLPYSLEQRGGVERERKRTWAIPAFLWRAGPHRHLLPALLPRVFILYPTSLTFWDYWLCNVTDNIKKKKKAFPVVGTYSWFCPTTLFRIYVNANNEEYFHQYLGNSVHGCNQQLCRGSCWVSAIKSSTSMRWDHVPRTFYHFLVSNSICVWITAWMRKSDTYTHFKQFWGNWNLQFWKK